MLPTVSLSQLEGSAPQDQGPLGCLFVCAVFYYARFLHFFNCRCGIDRNVQLLAGGEVKGPIRLGPGAWWGSGGGLGAW